MALAKTTQDHDEIRKWAEARGGKPAVVASTETDNTTGILRLMFPNAPNANDDALEEISWEEFFEKFDESGLELTYQEKTADGQISDFNKLTYPDPESPEGKKLLSKSAKKKGSAKKSAGTKAAAKTATKAAAKTAGKTAPAKKTAEKKAPPTKTAAKKTPAKKSAAKKTANKSASKKSSTSTPARNYPKPEHGGGNSQVY